MGAASTVHRSKQLKSSQSEKINQTRQIHSNKEACVAVININVHPDCLQLHALELHIETDIKQSFKVSNDTNGVLTSYVDITNP